MEIKDNIFICRLLGKFIATIDPQTNLVDKFNSLVDDYLRECETSKRTPNIIINLAETELVNATGLGAFISCLQTTRRLEGMLILVNVPEKVNNLLIITKLYSIFTTALSCDSAVALIKAKGTSGY